MTSVRCQPFAAACGEIDAVISGGVVSNGGAGGAPIDDPASFDSIVSTDCAAETRDAAEAVAGNSGLKSLGNGYWQLNWKTPKRYAGECRILRLTLGDDSIHTARFRFR